MKQSASGWHIKVSVSIAGKITLENNRHFATPNLVSTRNDVRGTSEIPY